jgi:uncharacterized membrane protein YqjE
MESHPTPLAALATTSKRLAQGLLAQAENRLELLLVEIQEERERLVPAILLALGMAVFGLLAGIALTVGIVVAFWEHSPLAALALLLVLYVGAGLSFHLRLRRLLMDWKTLPATFDQLRKDREVLGHALR